MDTQIQLVTSLTRYLNSLSGRNLSEHTATAYRTDLLQFLNWLAENDFTVNSSEKITRTHILDYLCHLANLGRSGVTRVRKLAAIREYCKFLVWEKSMVYPSRATGLLGHEKPETSFIYVHMARDSQKLMQQTSL